MDRQVHESVQEYYGTLLQGTKDLKTSACCTAESMPAHLRGIAAQIHPEIIERFYGCGSPIPAELEGRTVLDLGCGTGRDVYILSKLVGPGGHVIGVDMTEEQLAVARRHQDFHARAFGHERSNVRLVQGFIEDLAPLDIADASVDVVVSNCVINLSPAKDRVFSEIFRVLKPGGELYFSDVFTGRRVPEAVARDKYMLGECLGGALYLEDFRRLMARVGCADHRIVSRSRIAVSDSGIARMAGLIDFWSVTVRAFKLPFEDRCEDYGQTACYLGTIPETPHQFMLDDHHLFEKGRPMTVCGNTADMLTATRLAPHFRVTGDKSTHFGLFPCGPAPQAAAVGGQTPGACC